MTFIQSGKLRIQDTLPMVLNRTHVRGWNEALENAALHIEYQHPVWDQTGITPEALLDILAKNIRAMKIVPPDDMQEKP